MAMSGSISRPWPTSCWLMRRRTTPKLIGPSGLLSQVTKRVLETALEAETTEHLGYDKHDPVGRGTGNSRNGYAPRPS